MKLGEDLHEDRDEEEEHRGENERREHEDEDRIDHRALDAAPDRLLLLDLDGDAVEDDVEDSGRLARLDHRDVEAREDLRVPCHRLREHEPGLDVVPQLRHDLGERHVARLILEHDERLHDAQAGLDHRGELAGEDLERLRLHTPPERDPLLA